MSKPLPRASLIHRVRRALALATAALAIVLITAVTVGCHPRWTVVRQTPHTFASDTQFVVEPLHLEGMTVEGAPEAQFVAQKSDDQKALWESDKQAMAQAYVERMVADPALHVVAASSAAPGANAILVRAIVTSMEPGAFAGVVVQPTEVRITVQLLAAGTGELLDEVRLRTTVPAGVTTPSTGGRLRSASTDLGADTDEYLRSRM